MSETTRKPFATRRQLLGLGAGVILAGGIALAWPPPERVRLNRKRQAISAPFCQALTKAGTPCLNRTRSKAPFCWRHHPGRLMDPAKVIPPIIAKPSPLRSVLD